MSQPDAILRGLGLFLKVLVLWITCLALLLGIIIEILMWITAPTPEAGGVVSVDYVLSPADSGIVLLLYVAVLPAVLITVVLLYRRSRRS